MSSHDGPATPPRPDRADAAGQAPGSRSPIADSTWAAVLSEVFQAPLVLAALLVVLPWSAHGTLVSLAWGLAAALAVCGVSLATVTVLSRRGVLTDHHVSVKEHRRPVMIGTFLLVAAFLAVTLAFRGPVEITGLLTAILAASALVALVSPWWKISVHGMMMGGTAVILPVMWGPWGLLFIPVALAVCVSRRVLGAHTWPQLIAGTAYGAVFLGGLYWLIAG